MDCPAFWATTQPPAPAPATRKVSPGLGLAGRVMMTGAVLLVAMKPTLELACALVPFTVSQKNAPGTFVRP